MAEQQDDASKTEEPTQKRLDDARNKGQIPHSQEINHWFMIGAATLVFAVLANSGGARFADRMIAFFDRPHDLSVEPGAIGRLLASISWSSLLVLGPALGVFVVAALAGNLIQHRIVATTERIKPKFSKISPLSGVKRIFSLRGLTDFAKGILKLAVVGSVAAIVIWPAFGHLGELVTVDLLGTAETMRRLTVKMLIGILSVLFFIAAADFVYQRWEHLKGLRMSRQELKDEMKQTEGDPQIKSRIRALRMERARKRMMAAVPTADVVVTNPTHFAVALKYEPEKMAAPRVVAKGADLIALAIRRRAEENRVPVMENPPLARALFAACDIDQEVPVEHYKAVAEIIGYVYKLKGRSFGHRPAARR